MPLAAVAAFESGLDSLIEKISVLGSHYLLPNIGDTPIFDLLDPRALMTKRGFRNGEKTSESQDILLQSLQ